MLFGTEQKLDRLPHDPSFRFESRHGRVGEGGRVWERLKTVQTAEGFIDEGDTIAGRAKEEAIVVAVQVAVEGCQLGGREVGVI